MTGVDYVYTAVLRARTKLRKAGIYGEVLLSDVTKLDFLSGKFNLILDIGCFHGLNKADKSKYFANLQEFLDEKGIFLLYVFLKTSTNNFGIDQGDLQYLETKLNLEYRKDGVESNSHPSAWFKLINK